MISKQTIMLLDLINAGKNCNEICSELNITNKQLYVKLTNLKNKGILFERKYLSDGNILYNSVKNLHSFNRAKNDYYNKIFTSNYEKTIKVLAFSDIHFGNKLERLDLVNRAFNYSAREGIHIMFCCGDMIDGTFSKGEKTINDVYDQIDYFIKEYPFDKSILTFGVGGDHDLSALHVEGHDFIEAINNYRHDIILPSYNNSAILIKNDKIILNHYIPGGVLFKEGTVLLMGHRHSYWTNMDEINNRLCISVPALCDINKSLPTAIEMTFEFKNDKISQVLVRQVYFGDKDYVLNEINYNLNTNNIKEQPVPLAEEKSVSMEQMILEAVDEFRNLGNSKGVELNSKPYTLTKSQIRH